MTRGESVQQLRADARAIFDAALEGVGARKAVNRHLSVTYNGDLTIGRIAQLSLASFDRIFVIGAGKAAAAMAIAVEDILCPNVQMSGIVNVKYGHAAPRPRYISVNECSHPLPDQSGVDGVRKIERILEQLTSKDLLFVLISGGASALLPAPAKGISLEEKLQTTELLLRAGATIDELNAVRKHLSTLKGGQLAFRANSATIVSLILSDVVGDRLDVIGSGPTIPDSSTFSDALGALKKYNLLDSVPSTVRLRLVQGHRGEIAETPKEVDLLCKTVYTVVVGSNRLAIEAAREAASSLGYKTLILSSTLQGEAREVAQVHAEILREVISSGNPIQRRACILSGGETTVTVLGMGKGGRNQEFALAAAISMSGLPNAVVLAAGTDGTDGPTDAAGAIVDGTTLLRANAKGLSLTDHLERNDSYTILEALDDLVKTGPTGTNVMDLNIMLVGDDFGINLSG
jgi:glycerate 2-kinase